MRRILIAAAVPLLASAAPPATMQTLDVPQDLGPQQVIFQAREFAPGAQSGWHVHPGVEMATVISGEMEIVTAGGVRRLTPGDSFQMPRGTAHNGINPGSAPAKVVITLVIDKGAEPRQSVAAP
jgi:quercetin dioxygenase-like cupin family protein